MFNSIAVNTAKGYSEFLRHAFSTGAASPNLKFCVALCIWKFLAYRLSNGDNSLPVPSTGIKLVNPGRAYLRSILVLVGSAIRPFSKSFQSTKLSPV